MIEVSYEKFVELLSNNVEDSDIRDNDTDMRASLKNIKEGKRVFIWPAGKIGLTVYELLKANCYENLFLVDRDDVIDNSLHPNDIKFQKGDVVIVASLNYSKSIYQEAEKLGCKNIIMYYSIKALGTICSIVFPSDFYDECFEKSTEHLLKNINQYKEMYWRLEDKRSKRVFLDNMFFRLTNDIRYTFDKDGGTQYFTEGIIELTENDVIVDAGGYTGDTLQQFLNLQIEFNKYYLFEPSNNLIKKAKKVTNDVRVEYISKGLHSSNGRMFFSKDGEAGGYIKKQKEIYDDLTVISVVSIDEYIEGRVSFIKMDIEGAELEALKGAKNTIQKYKPNLAISIYHKPSDYLDIFNYIITLDSNYKFYLRKYTDGYGDAVLYAVSK